MDTHLQSPDDHSDVNEDQTPQQRYDIPYFAHMRLDPAHFPKEIGWPVGSFPHLYVKRRTSSVQSVELDDSAEEDIVLNGSTGLECTPAPNSKRRRDSEGVASVAANKRLKVPGGRPAVAKKITADLDSDDDLIVRMKEAKYLEKDIAQRLVDEGRIAYHPKTIGTRWRRIRKVLQDRQDELLDAELTDWHDGDDDVLYQAVAKADAEVEKAIEAARSHKWRIVADEMKTIKPVVNFSQNACRIRYDNLQNGTAKPTPEAVAEPDATTLERIRSRQDKERKIAEDSASRSGSLEEGNARNNAWTSRMRKYV